jgi:dTDP-4-amino-4,6-dideoxygalactose transaminase
MEIFKGSFTQQEPLSQEAIDAATRVLNTGRLHRYNLKEGDAGEVASLELEFAKIIGSKFCLAVASGGYALATALRAVGVKAEPNGFDKCIHFSSRSWRNCIN